MKSRDFPSCPVVKNPPCNIGNVGLIHGLGTKILHAKQQLSPHAYHNHWACVPELESLWAKTKIPHDAVKTPSATTKTSMRQINKYRKKKKNEEPYS